MHYAYFWKSAVDFSDTGKRTELHNSFNSENMYHIGKQHRKFIVAENGCLRVQALTEWWNLY